MLWVDTLYDITVHVIALQPRVIMESGPTQPKISRHTPLTIAAATKKLLKASKLIACREGIKLNEEKRIQHAFALLVKPPEGASKTAERQNHYRQFLRQAERVGGREMVVLCAVGLGQSSVASMRDRDRLLLPLEFKGHKSAYQCDVLRDVVKKYSIKETPAGPPPVQPASLTGDVYELTVADAQGVVMSDHLRGQIYLTNTYRVESAPFITIPISRELSDHFAAQRRQIM